MTKGEWPKPLRHSSFGLHSDFWFRISSFPPLYSASKSTSRRTPMPHLLGIDIGTSGTKTLICDQDGEVLATSTAEHSISSPKPGWSEQDPQQWWDATCKATRAVLRKAKVRGSDIGAIGLSGQMHGSVFLAEGEKPLR